VPDADRESLRHPDEVARDWVSRLVVAWRDPRAAREAQASSA